MKKILSLSLLSLMLFVACNKKAEEKPADTSASTETPAVTETAAVSDEVADAPEGCPNKTSVVVKSDETGTVNMNTVNSWYVETSPDWGTFYFTNYEFNPQDAYGHTYAAKDATAYFDISTIDKTPIANGEWDSNKADANNKTGGFSISSAETSRGLIGSNKKVTITYFGGDYVCGNVTADDGYGSITGDFIARYYKWKSSF